MITPENAWVLLMVAALLAVFIPISVMAWHYIHETGDTNEHPR